MLAPNYTQPPTAWACTHCAIPGDRLLAPSPTGALHRSGRLILAASGPALLLALFWAEATGALLDVVKLSDARYGADPRYREYVATTPLLFPTASSVARLWTRPMS